MGRTRTIWCDVDGTLKLRPYAQQAAERAFPGVGLFTVSKDTTKPRPGDIVIDDEESFRVPGVGIIRKMPPECSLLPENTVVIVTPGEFLRAAKETDGS